MQVEKWGDSLAIRLPSSLVEDLGLREGDEVELYLTKPPDPGAMTDEARAEAIRRLRALPFPPGFRFNREEANER